MPRSAPLQQSPIRLRRTVWYEGDSLAECGPRRCDIGAHFDEKYCVLCGDLTEAFAAQAVSLELSGLRARLHHWPLEAGYRRRIAGKNQQFCHMHAMRLHPRNRYASHKRSLDQLGPSRTVLLDLLAKHYPVLLHPQARRRALLFLARPMMVDCMQYDADEELTASLEARAKFLDRLLGKEKLDSADLSWLREIVIPRDGTGLSITATPARLCPSLSMPPLGRPQWKASLVSRNPSNS